jgi:hypothetical protein
MRRRLLAMTGRSPVTKKSQRLQRSCCPPVFRPQHQLSHHHFVKMNGLVVLSEFGVVRPDHDTLHHHLTFS